MAADTVKMQSSRVEKDMETKRRPEEEEEAERQAKKRRRAPHLLRRP